MGNSTDKTKQNKNKADSVLRDLLSKMARTDRQLQEDAMRTRARAKIFFFCMTVAIVAYGVYLFNNGGLPGLADGFLIKINSDDYTLLGLTKEFFKVITPTVYIISFVLAFYHEDCRPVQIIRTSDGQEIEMTGDQFGNIVIKSDNVSTPMSQEEAFKFIKNLTGVTERETYL